MKKKQFISSIWDFKNLTLNETNYLTHDFLRWYGKLVPQLVGRLVSMYSKPNDLVLANFAGSGTVLVEACVAGRKAMGVDSHPLAVLLSKVKTTPVTPDTAAFLKSIEGSRSSFPSEPLVRMPEWEKWYRPQSLATLQWIVKLADRLENEADRDFFRLAAASIARAASMVDNRSVNHMVLDKTRKEIDVVDAFASQLQEMKAGVKELARLAPSPDVSVVRGDARNLDSFHSNSVDLIISHPPYFGAINYPNINKLASELLGFNYREIQLADFSNSTLATYQEALTTVLGEMYRVLKPGRKACVIIGDTRRDGDVVPISSWLMMRAISSGFLLSDVFIWILNQKAGMNVARRGNHIDHNFIIVLTKPASPP